MEWKREREKNARAETTKRDKNTKATIDKAKVGEDDEIVRATEDETKERHRGQTLPQRDVGEIKEE